MPAGSAKGPQPNYKYFAYLKLYTALDSLKCEAYSAGYPLYFKELA